MSKFIGHIYGYKVTTSKRTKPVINNLMLYEVVFARITTVSNCTPMSSYQKWLTMKLFEQWNMFAY